MLINKSRLIRSSRILLAMVTGFIITKICHIEHPLWLFITSIVVIFDQSTVGGTVLRGSLRFSATIVGAIIGLLVLFIFHNNQAANDITILICILIFAYLFMDTKYSYIGVIGSITILIVLSTDLSNSDGISIGIDRIISILLGTIIAVANMIFFYPNYAKHSIVTHIDKSLEKIEITIKIFTNNNYSTSEISERILQVESEITTDITKFNRLIDEMKYETITKINYPSTFIHIRRINRLLNVIFLEHNDKDIRTDIKLIKKLTQITNELDAIRQRLSNNSKNKINLKILKYSEQAISHELIFIYSIVNKVIKELIELDTALTQIGI